MVSADSAWFTTSPLNSAIHSVASVLWKVLVENTAVSLVSFPNPPQSGNETSYCESCVHQVSETQFKHMPN